MHLKQLGRRWRANRARGAHEAVGKGAAAVMTFAKISAGSGYLYLIRHTALGDAEPAGRRDAASYYAAQGNPPGRWTGRGAPLLGVTGRMVTEGQMRALFGLGAHPDMDALVDAYIDARWRPWMTGERWDRLVGEAIRSATLGRQFPRYQQLDSFGDRVAARLNAIRDDTGREPTEAEAGWARAREARRQRDAIAGLRPGVLPGQVGRPALGGGPAPPRAGGDRGCARGGKGRSARGAGGARRVH